MAWAGVYEGWVEGEGYGEAEETGDVCISCNYTTSISANDLVSPETMGAVCAVVYLLALIFFIPFAFYKDIVAATSGGGNRDVVLEVHHVETGRYLHRFPHGRVGLLFVYSCCFR